MSYIQTVSLEDRTAECQRVMQEHPNEIPVVVECANGRVRVVTLPRDATVAELEAAVRSGSALTGKKLGITVSGNSPAPSTAVADLYALCKGEDGFLYAAYRGERAMGARQLCCTNTGDYLADIENNPNIIGSYV